jgi:hypothetical protein
MKRIFAREEKPAEHIPALPVSFRYHFDPPHPRVWLVRALGSKNYFTDLKTAQAFFDKNSSAYSLEECP